MTAGPVPGALARSRVLRALAGSSVARTLGPFVPVIALW